MKAIILFILLWASPLPMWAKYVLTTLWVFEVLCSNVDTTDTKKKK